MNFFDLTYLSEGNETQKEAYRVLHRYHIFEALKDYYPVLTGTIPLGIAIEGSDLDIACKWDLKAKFVTMLVTAFSMQRDFNVIEKCIGGHETVIARFVIKGIAIEIFGQNRHVSEQESFRHMCVEWKILQHKGEEFKKQVVLLKMVGVKTEPAFAQLLGLRGDPYQALLEYEVDEE